MSRLFWIAVGATGGILLYRRGQRYAAEARERGVVLTAQQAAASALAAVGTVRAAVALQDQAQAAKGR